MFMSKTLTVATCFCMLVATSWAQLPQLQMEQLQKKTPAKVSVEQLKENLNAMKLQSSSMKMEKINLSNKAMKPMTGIIPGTKQQVMTRAGEFGAYYELPAGLYNLKPGFEYMEGVYSRHGILAPIYQDVVFKNSSTNAANFDWYINNTVVFEDSISVTYVPGGDTFYSPMPELTAYANTGIDSTYQYGYAFDYETGKFTEGQAVNIGFGYVHNLDVGAESFYNTYMNTMNGYWTQMLFGYHEENNADYFEIFEKPLHPVVLNSVFTYIATPVNREEIAEKEFSVYVMTFDEKQQAWTKLSEKVYAKPAGKLGSLEECDVWSLNIYFEKPLLVKDQFALVFSGPQDGSAYWAFMYQDDRDLYSGKVTAGYIPQEGEYAGYLSPYALMPEGATEPVAYPASLDLGLQLFMPYNMALDPTTFDFINYGGYTVIGAEGLNAPTYLWNWEAYIMGSKASMNITSDVSWLSAEITKQAADDSFLYDVTIYAEPLPEGVAGRRGVLTFTDGQGYQSTWTFVQGDEAAGIEEVTVSQDSNAPIYDLTGRLVSNPTKGIYIQNGKKIIVE